MRLTVAGFMNPRDGYGYGTLNIIKALREAGVKVTALDLGRPELGAPEAQRWQTDAPTLAICLPEWLPQIETGGAPLYVHTMFEATRLPAGWVETLNARAARVIVPCAWNVEVFRANGVTVPMGVARWGIEQTDYYALTRPERDSRAYTFVWSGTPDGRKGWDIAYRAFRQAFGGRDDVHLLLHFRALPPGLQGVRDTNVELRVGLLARARLREMLREADCFVFPSRGEGWGLPPREAAATGLPVLATNYGGLAEELAYWGKPIRVAGMSQAEFGVWGDVGEWCEPDVAHTAELMEHCYSNPRAAAEEGWGAALWLQRKTPWERTARALLAEMGAAG